MPLSKIQTLPATKRNKVINGAGQIAQRKTTAAETSAFVLDRWRIDAYNQDQLALQVSQSSDTPSGLGFHTSHLVNVNTAETAVASDEYLRYYQTIEARNLQDIGYGGSSPKKMQLTFWVKATGTNVTGTYGVTFWIPDANKYQTASYTISAADTWEKKTIEIGTTGHAAIANDSGQGLRINFFLMAGSGFTSGTYANQWGTAAGSPGNTHFAGGHSLNTFTSTVGNKWYMTGCQLEVADSPTEYEHRLFAEELRLCMRYYEKSYNYGVVPGSAGTSSATNYQGAIFFTTAHNNHHQEIQYKERKRAVPTLVIYNTHTGATGQNYSHHDNASTTHSDTWANGENGTRVSFAGTGDGERTEFHYTAESEI